MCERCKEMAEHIPAVLDALPASTGPLQIAFLIKIIFDLYGIETPTQEEAWALVMDLNHGNFPEKLH